jgi:O-antigen/teichoic acid export membrane protein
VDRSAAARDRTASCRPGGWFLARFEVVSTPIETATAPDVSATGAVVRNFLTLGAGELLSRVLGFAGTIWIARQLGTDGYGIYGFGFAVLLYFGAVGDLGMEHLGPREVAERRVPLGTLASSMVLSRFVASGIIALAMAAIGLFVMHRPDGVVLALFALTLIPMGATTRWIHLGLENAGAVSLSRFVIEAIRVALLFAFVHGPGDLYRAPLAQFAGECGAALFLFFALRARGVHLGFRIDTSVVREILRRGFPLLITNLLALVIYNADVVLLGVFRGETEVGLYLAAYTLINFLGVLGNTATLAILPSLSRLRATAERGMELYHTSMAQVLAVGLPVAVGGAMLAPRIIMLVFGTDYTSAAPILRILILTIPVLLLRSVLIASLIASGRQDRVLHTTAWAAALTFTGDIVLIPRYGMLGAAIVTVVAECARMIAAQVYAGREGYVRTRPGRYARAFIAALVMAGVLVLLRGSPLWITIPAGAFTWILVLFALGGLRVRDGGVHLTV